MERAHPQKTSQPGIDQVRYPFLHFLGCLVCKSQGKDRRGRNSLFQHVGNPACQHLCFAASGTRNDQRWSCDIFNRLFLSLIQLLQIVLLHVDKYREKADENFIFAFANI